MKRGPYKVDQQLFNLALELRAQGYGYRTIADKLKMKWGTIRNWLINIPVDPKEAWLKSNKKHHKIYRFENLKTNAARRERLIQELGHQCSGCSNTEWLGEPIPIELDHINGDRTNNSRENLRLLCPNCHAKTSTYKGKNIKRLRGEMVNAAGLNPAGETLVGSSPTGVTKS